MKRRARDERRKLKVMREEDYLAGRIVPGEPNQIHRMLARMAG